MRILFISRATLLSSRGGDTIQIENTAKALSHFGVNVDIVLCNNMRIDYKQYDLIHFFNIIRPADIIYHIDRTTIPFVVSPIYLTYHDLITHDKTIKGLLLSAFGKHEQEYVKCIARNIFNSEKIISKKYLLFGHKRSIEYILKRCSCLLPNSKSEYERLKTDFNIAGHFSVIPNAVDTSIFYEAKETKRKEKSILCVARIEPLKNQLNIIRALSGTDYRLTIAGAISRNHRAYFEACKNEATSNVTFIDYSSQKEVARLYNEHETHVLASWFETTGLSTLEAAVCGCNIVITDKGDTKEYFQDVGYYCDPADTRSIREAIEQAMNSAKNKDFPKKIIRENNWEQTAKKTYDAYVNVMNKYKKTNKSFI